MNFTRNRNQVVAVEPLVDLNGMKSANLLTVDKHSAGLLLVSLSAKSLLQAY